MEHFLEITKDKISAHLGIHIGEHLPLNEECEDE